MKLKSLNSKKAAIEMSMGTMVIMVIAVVMLVLALMFVRNIFGSANENIDQIDKGVRDQINTLFNQDNQRVAVYLTGNTAEVKQQETFGVGFGVQNIGPSGSFEYEAEATEVSSQCSNLGTKEATSWIELGRVGRMEIPSGDVEVGLIKITTSSTAPIGCKVRYNVVINKEGELYKGFFFDVEIKPKGLGGLF